MNKLIHWFGYSPVNISPFNNKNKYKEIQTESNTVLVVDDEPSTINSITTNNNNNDNFDSISGVNTIFYDPIIRPFENLVTDSESLIDNPLGQPISDENFTISDSLTITKGDQIIGSPNIGNYEPFPSILLLSENILGGNILNSENFVPPTEPGNGIF